MTVETVNAFERGFTEELQMQKTAGLSKTAADQIDEILSKMGAAIDGSDLMNKKNPVGKTNSGVDAGSVEEGLQAVGASKYGRGVREKTLRDRVMQSKSLEQGVVDPALFSPERGGYPLRRTGGLPKVGKAQQVTLTAQANRPVLKQGEDRNEKDRYVQQVGRQAGRQGALVGGLLGSGAGGMSGVALGKRIGHPVLGAAVGALAGGLGGSALGSSGLRGLAERSAAKLSPGQRRQATEYNVAHSRYRRGDLSRKEYSKATAKFMRSQGLSESGGPLNRTMGKEGSFQSTVEKLASSGQIRTLEEWR